MGAFNKLQVGKEITSSFPSRNSLRERFYPGWTRVLEEERTHCWVLSGLYRSSVLQGSIRVSTRVFRAFGSDLLHPCFALNTLNHGNYGRPGGGFGLGASIIPPFVGLAGGGGIGL